MSRSRRSAPDGTPGSAPAGRGIGRSLYRTLLRAYPAEFRRRFGDVMLADYERLTATPRYSGLGGRIALWARLLRDLLKSAPKERAHRRRRVPRLRGGLPGGPGSDFRSSLRVLWLLTKGFRVWARARRAGAVVVITLAVTVSLAATTASVVSRLRAELQPAPGTPLLFVGWMSAGQFSDLRDSGVAFEALGAYYGDAEQRRALRDENGIALVSSAHLSRNIFHVLGTRPLLGTDFGLRDERLGATAIAISYGLWEARYQRDADVIGRQVSVDDVDGTIVAVLPEGFRFPFTADVWVEVASAEDLGDPSRTPVGVFGALSDGVPVEAAKGEAQEFFARAAGANEGRAPRFEFRPFNEVFLPPVVQTIGRFGLWGAVGLLVLGCFNVAGLLLAHGLARLNTYRLHRALGAHGGTLAMVGIGEALPVALGGATLGLGLSPFLNGLYNQSAAGRMPFWTVGPLQWDLVLGIAAAGFAVAIVAGSAVSGCLALGSGRRSLSSRQGVGRRGLRVLSAATLVVQVGVSVSLVVLATSWALTVANARWGAHGFDARGVYVARVVAPDTAFSAPEARAELDSTILRRLSLEFGPEDRVALASSVPGTGIGRARVAVEGQAYTRPEDVPRAAITVVSADFFDVAGITTVRGATLDLDQTDAPLAVVSLSFARDYLGGTDAVGTRIRVGGPESQQPWLLVVGVAGDVYEGVGAMGLGGVPPAAHVYAPMSLFPSSTFDVLVRSDRRASTIETGLRRVVEGVDARIALEAPRTWPDALVDAMLLHTGSAKLFALFAAVALVLAAGGIFGATVYEVHRRAVELAVRTALGAPPAAVVRHAFSKPLASTLCGLAAGTVGGYVAVKSLAALIHGLQFPSPGVILSIGLTLTGVAVCAAIPSLSSVLRANPGEIIRAQGGADPRIGTSAP